MPRDRNGRTPGKGENRERKVVTNRERREGPARATETYLKRRKKSGPTKKIRGKS